MVNPFIKRLIVQVSTIVAKSVMKAYENTIKNHRGGAQPKNPFTEYFSKIAQSNPMVKKTMDRSEALKIFNIEAPTAEIDPQKIMESYTKMFQKNDPSKGGSFYLQSKIWCAKEEIMKDFPGAEKEFYEAHGVEDPAKGKKAEAAAKEEKKEENKAEATEGAEAKEGEEKKN